MHGLTLAGWRGRSDHDEPAWPNAAGGTRCSQCSYTYICTRMHIITMDRHRPWWCRSLATMCRPWTLTLTTYAKDVIELQRWKLSCWCMRSGSCSWDDVQHASSNLEAWAVAYSCCPFVGVRHEHVCELQVVATRSHWMGVPSSTQLSLCACCSCHIICHCVSQAWLESAHPSQGGRALRGGALGLCQWSLAWVGLPKLSALFKLMLWIWYDMMHWFDIIDSKLTCMRTCRCIYTYIYIYTDDILCNV